MTELLRFEEGRLIPTKKMMCKPGEILRCIELLPTVVERYSHHDRFIDNIFYLLTAAIINLKEDDMIGYTHPRLSQEFLQNPNNLLLILFPGKYWSRRQLTFFHNRVQTERPIKQLVSLGEWSDFNYIHILIKQSDNLPSFEQMIDRALLNLHYSRVPMYWDHSRKLAVFVHDI